MKLLPLILLLPGCAQLGIAVDKAADANDQALIDAEFVICNAASVGAIERRYNSKQLLNAREVICNLERISK